jgi:cystathionine beta-lyase/cystathionine gamma-synthase
VPHRPSDRLSTLLIHAGEPEVPIEGAVSLPVFQSATFVLGSAGGESTYDDLRYVRLSNTPNHQVLHAKLAALAGAEAGLVTASGMAAIHAVLAAHLEAGDHFLVQRCVYGGTHSLVHRDAGRFGWSFDVIEADAPETWAALLQPRTRVIYVETIANPLLAVAELEAVAAFARERGLVSVIDNTFASPVNCRPHELGFDLVVESCTKYLNGHSDIVAGCVTGSAAALRRVRSLANHLGGCLDPHAAFLLRRGLQTLGLRMGRHNENGLALAPFLAGRADVERVRYPYLESQPDYARAKRLLRGGGGVVSFEVAGGPAAADRVLRRLRLARLAPSLGGVETLVTRPVTTSHLGLSPDERAAAGIPEGLIRVAVGLEDAEDLCADFGEALEAL